jgi:hypothetical protein
VTAVIDPAQATTLGAGGDPTASIALSLGGPSPTPGGPNVASNLSVVRMVSRVKSF